MMEAVQTLMSKNAGESRQTRQSKKANKQELCHILDTLDTRKIDIGSPDRLSRMYALLQTADKGANRLGSNPKKNFFNEHIKMSSD